MSESRKFTYRNLDWVCSIEFFPDRLEYSWDYFGWGVDKQKKVTPRQELAPHLTEITGMASRSEGMKGLRWAAGYLILAMFSHALLPLPWRNSTYIFLLGFAVVAYGGVRRLQKGHWIQILRRDGKPTVSLQVRKWTDEERKEFRRFYEAWINRPEWAEGLTLDS